MEKNGFSIWFLLHSLYSNNSLPEINIGENRVEAARKSVLYYIWQEMKKYEETHPPFLRGTDLSKLPFVKSRKIKEIRFSETKKFDGFLLPQKDGFNIIINKNLRDTQKRTAIAHEIAHTFLYNIHNEPPSPFHLHNGLDWDNEEGPVYEISRSILVPEEWIRRHDKKPSLDAFNKLRLKFNVSKDVMARRIIHDLKIWDVYIFFANYNHNRECFDLPPYKWRFRSPIKSADNAIKNFKLEENWKTIELILQASCRNFGNTTEKSIKIDDRRYNVEAIYRENSSSIACMISKDCSPMQSTFAYF